MIAECELPEMRIRATELITNNADEPEDKDLPPGEEQTTTNDEIFDLSVDNPGQCLTVYKVSVRVSRCLNESCLLFIIFTPKHLWSCSFYFIKYN